MLFIFNSFILLKSFLEGPLTRIVAKCSGNIIKNVRCVRIPNSGGMTGIEAACTLGAVSGDAERNMEVLESVTKEGLDKSVAFLREWYVQQKSKGCANEKIS